MKIAPANSFAVRRRRHGQQGMAVIVVILIISILLIYIGGNLRTLHLMRQDLKQIEQKQVSRFKATPLGTNSVAITNYGPFTPGTVLKPAE